MIVISAVQRTRLNKNSVRIDWRKLVADYEADLKVGRGRAPLSNENYVIAMTVNLCHNHK